MKAIRIFEFTFHVIDASHLTHTPCHDKCNSLLTPELGQLHRNQSFWCDNGFVETDLQPCFKKNLDKSHTGIASERTHDFKAVAKRWVQICRLWWIWQMGTVFTWVIFVFSYHLRKIASLSFCPGSGISVHCLVLAYQYYTSLLLSVCSDHIMRYNKMWLLWISCVLCHASLTQCSALRNFGMPFNTFLMPI